MWQEDDEPTPKDLQDDLPDDYFDKMRKELFRLYKQEWKLAFNHYLNEEFAEANEAIVNEVSEKPEQ